MTTVDPADLTAARRTVHGSDDAGPDLPVTLSRRRLLTFAGLGAAAAAGTALFPASAAASGAAATTVVATADCSTDSDEQEVGPFYVADGLVRSDIVSGEDGVALTLTITLTDSTGCGPLAGAAVDLWQANALGVYSDESSEDTVGETYLRGVQITDSAGRVTFTTIFPGWYAGRTMHIHLRVYTGGTVNGTTYSYTDATLIHTGQMFFDPDTSTTVAAVAPYTSNPNTPRTVNSTDRVYTEQDGDTSLITTSGSVANGYTGSIALTVTRDSTDTGGGSSTPDTTSLTINSSATHVRAGSKLTLSGQLKDTTTAKGIADHDITLTATLPNGKTYSKVIETDDDGSWTCTFKPTTTTTYRVTYIGSSAYAAAKSSAVTVPVEFHLVLSHVSGTANHHKAITATGHLTPARKGHKITIHAITSTGAVRRLTTTTTNAKGYWTAHWHMSKGRHRIVATVAGDSSDRTATSRTVVVHRT